MPHPTYPHAIRSPRRRALPRARLPRAARVALAAGALALTGGTAGAAASRGPAPQAQAEGAGYGLVEEWAPARPQGIYRALDWPAGHEPGGLGIDPASGRIVAADREAGRLRLYRPDGRFQAEIGSDSAFQDPYDAAFLPDGRILLSDAGRDEVVLLSEQGARLDGWAVPAPRGVAVHARGLGFPDEEVALLVVSASERRLRVYGADGAERDAISLAGTISPTLLAGLEWAAAPGDPPAADLLAVDRGALPGLRVLPSGGTAWRFFAHPGLRAGLALQALTPGAQGEEPAAVAGVDGQGLLPLDPTGLPYGPEATIPFARVADVARGGRGELAATVLPEGLVAFDDDIGGLLAQLRRDTFGRWFRPRALGAGDRLLLGDALPRLQVLSREGRPRHDVRLPEDPLAPAPAPPIDVAADGELEVALLPGGRMHRFEDDRFTLFRDPPRGVATHALALTAQGGRLAALDLLQQAVILYDERLRETERWSLTPEGEEEPLVDALDLAVTAERLYLALPGPGRLLVRTRAGALVRSLPLPGGAERVAAGPDGDAFVLDAGGRVVRVAPDGEPRGRFLVAGPEERPTDLALDAQGRLYLAYEDGAIRVYAPDPDAPLDPLPPQPAPGSCSLTADKQAWPPEIELGETVEVRLRIEGRCEAAPRPADIVLAVDRSRSMAQGGRLSAAIDAAIGFAARAGAAGTRLALVEFDGSARSSRPLSAERMPLLERLAGLSPGGDTNLVAALREAEATLAAGLGAPGPAREPVLVLLTDGRHTLSDPPASEIEMAVASLRASGVRVFAIGLGPEPDLDQLRAMARDESHVLLSPTPRDLGEVYARIARRIEAAPLLRDGLLQDEIPANMELLPGSAEPPAVLGPGGRSLRWVLTEAGGPALHWRFRLRPREPGVWPTNVRARADLTDGLGGKVGLVFPIPQVAVLEDGRLPRTATPTGEATPTGPASPSATAPASATPAASPTPSATSSPSATPTPRPSATPRPPRIFLPNLLRGCRAARPPLDLVLVLDASTSMREPTEPGGPPKIDAAAAAAGRFLGGLDLPRDRGAIVAFDAQARRVQGLTGQLGALALGLADLRTAPGSRIDLGLDEAGRILDARRDRARRSVVVLVTDGRPSGADESAMLAAALRLRDRGTTVAAIGLGRDAAPEVLALLVSAPGLAWTAPDAAALDEAWRALEGALPCG